MYRFVRRCRVVCVLAFVCEYNSFDFAFLVGVIEVQKIPWFVGVYLISELSGSSGLVVLVR